MKTQYHVFREIQDYNTSIPWQEKHQRAESYLKEVCMSKKI